jgi:hypothetical protein
MRCGKMGAGCFPLTAASDGRARTALMNIPVWRQRRRNGGIKVNAFTSGSYGLKLRFHVEQLGRLYVLTATPLIPIIITMRLSV